MSPCPFPTTITITHTHTHITPRAPPVVVNSIRIIYLHGLNKGLDSKFRICARVKKKQLKKADGDIGQNVVNITIATGLLVRIPWIKKVKLVTVVYGDPKAPFSIATTPRRGGDAISFPGLLHFTLDPYLINMSVKQWSIKYHFFVFGMTRRGIEPTNQHANVQNTLTDKKNYSPALLMHLKVGLLFCSLWYDLSWDWTSLSRSIGKHCNHYANISVEDMH